MKAELRSFTLLSILSPHNELLKYFDLVSTNDLANLAVTLPQCYVIIWRAITKIIPIFGETDDLMVN